MAETDYSIDLSKNIIYSHYIGDWAAADILKQISIVRQDPKFRSGLNAIIDFRHAHISQGYLEAESVALFVKNSTHITGGIKIAFLVTAESTDGVGVFESIIHFFQLTSEAKGFETMAEAESWLST